MELAKITKFPTRIRVSGVVNSRYPGHHKPLSWDDRKDGTDTIKSDDGRILKLWSDGGQSTPQKGWVIMISGGNEVEGYHWTLYGMPRETGQNAA